ncbi:NAD(P)/FAD-dependent oxidoreductase [Nonomuraea sp. GTA35]|uniref:NAD(P)/FAD-dependent oxidoreductase n=1 Tax=Nonomuraea sp. GTA35 TaxID=1676746 RepID=UPI0035C13F37
MKSVIVVGAGIWGSSLALRLAETGWRVTLVEQHRPGHVRQASAGETRLLRCAHGADDWYARRAWEARDGWRRLGERAGEELYLEAGMVWFARTPGGWEHASAQVLKGLDIECEELDPADGARFFPDFSGDGLLPALGAERGRDQGQAGHPGDRRPGGVRRGPAGQGAGAARAGGERGHGRR